MQRASSQQVGLLASTIAHQALLLLRGMSWAGQVFILQHLKMSLTYRRQQYPHSEAMAILRELETCGLLLGFAACCWRAHLPAMLVAHETRDMQSEPGPIAATPSGVLGRSSEQTNRISDGGDWRPTSPQIELVARLQRQLQSKDVEITALKVSYAAERVSLRIMLTAVVYGCTVHILQSMAFGHPAAGADPSAPGSCTAQRRPGPA